jgi:serine protease Do
MRNMRSVVGALSLLLGLSPLAPSTVTAQDPLGAPVRKTPEARAFITMPRAEIGVVLGDAVEVAGRTGVRVIDVRAGGPAQRAGVRAEDVILTLDGEPLGTEPARRVVDLMRSVEVGDTVALLVRRGGQDLTVQVVTERGQFALDLAERIREQVLPARAEIERAREALRRVALVPATRGLELVDVNPRLGRYFGVEAGVLVADVPPDSPLGLQPGDVIVGIDGRAPRDRAHVRSILASYRADEEIELRVVRDRQTITVRGTSREG